jgi:hypothetical protein
VPCALLVLGARYCYQQLRPLWDMSGWIIAPDLRKSVFAEWLLIFACIMPFLLPPLRNRLRRSGIARWLRVPIVLGTVNAVVMTWTLQHPPSQTYYVAKYNLHSLWLLAAAALGLIAALAAAPADTAARRRCEQLSIAPIAIALFTAGVLWSQAIAIYRPGFVERAFGRPPFKVLHPLADLGAWKRIERVLKREHKQFGGYLTTYYPVMNFMNAAFGFANGGIHFYYGRPPHEGAGYCDFWEGGSPSTWLEGDFPQRRRREDWNLQPDKQCVSYPASWNPSLIRTLCWFCR